MADKRDWGDFPRKDTAGEIKNRVRDETPFFRDVCHVLVELNCLFLTFTPYFTI
jgi:hypothetical protein